MSQETLCSKCGAPVSGEVARGFCTACLLEEGLAHAERAQNPITLRHFGDYELIEEIARGGMGVVFKARQRSLNRIVAVKMILSGHLASEAQAQRFRAEARAAAALQHPGIVAVHEVGEHEGLLFFSMDYIVGQSLAQLVRDGPWPAARAAHCVRDIAEAIGYAHEQGVLHRDLKPSNVLIDGLGKPHVTDFGLAKQLTSDSGLQTSDLTLTGQILGSPSFIPPEQAAGQKSAIGPASDVYSLGAILFHCLTGRPPFVAETLTQTLRMVVEQEAVSPRLLNASVPRDLETICLKCLEKDPKRRYETAESLARDVGRHLNNEPVSACPPSRIYRFQKSVRRHKLACSAAAVITAVLMAGITTSTWQAIRATRAERGLMRLLEESSQAAEREAQLRKHAEDASANEAALRVETEAARANEVVLRQQAETSRANEASLRQQAEIAERIARFEAGQLGEALRKLGMADQAEQHIRHALAMQNKQLTNNTPERAALLNNLANVLLAQGKNLPEAEQASREALLLRKELLGSEHPEVAASLDRLGMALRLQGKYAEAESAHLEALTITRKSFGDAHEDVMRSLFALAGDYQFEGRIAEAEVRYNETVSVARSVLGNEHPYVPSVLNIAAQMLLDNGKASEAEPLARECLALRQKKSPDDWLTFNTQYLLGGILLEQRKYDEVEQLLLTAYEGMMRQAVAAPDGNHAALHGVVQRVVQLYEATGQSEQAALWRNALGKP